MAKKSWYEWSISVEVLPGIVEARFITEAYGASINPVEAHRKALNAVKAGAISAAVVRTRPGKPNSNRIIRIYDFRDLEPNDT